MTETYLRPADVAEKINVSLAKLAIDRMHGVGLPFVVFGTSIRYAASAVEAYMLAHTVEPGRPAPAGVKRRCGGPGRCGLRASRRAKGARRAR